MKYMRGLVLAIPLVLGVVGSNISDVKNINSYKGVYYDNFNYTDNVTFKRTEGLNLDYDASLRQVGDYYEIIFDVINDSNVDVEIANFKCNKDDSYIDYELTYENGKEIKTGDIIKKGQSKKIKYYVHYKNPIEEDNYQFDSSFSIDYEQVL